MGTVIAPKTAAGTFSGVAALVYVPCQKVWVCVPPVQRAGELEFPAESLWMTADPIGPNAFIWADVGVVVSWGAWTPLRERESVRIAPIGFGRSTVRNAKTLDVVPVLLPLIETLVPSRVTAGAPSH